MPISNSTSCFLLFSFSFLQRFFVAIEIHRLYVSWRLWIAMQLFRGVSTIAPVSYLYNFELNSKRNNDFPKNLNRIDSRECNLFSIETWTMDALTYHIRYPVLSIGFNRSSFWMQFTINQLALMDILRHFTLAAHAERLFGSMTTMKCIL